jgi:hypothetical protein
MSKAISYYDWSLGFKKNLSETGKEEFISNHLNSIGLSKDDFKTFLENWKEKNL